jgi:hypothetical protein
MMNKDMIRPIVAVIVTALLMYVSIDFFFIKNPVFDISQFQKEKLTRESFMTDREVRNEAAIKRSYSELMTLGDSYLGNHNLRQARDYYFLAKTLYPTRIEPRKQLCYIDILLCQQNSRYCSYTKKEIYYAMQHVADDDDQARAYILKLAELMKIDSLLTLNEGEALSAIF